MWTGLLRRFAPRNDKGLMKYSHYYKPMLCTLVEGPFDDPDWGFEIKWDGYRAIAEIGPRSNKLYSRNGLSFEDDYPDIFDALARVRHTVVIDGEIVALDSRHRPRFQLLQKYKDNPDVPLYYYVFDMLALDGRDIRALPLSERKVMLKRVLPGGARSLIRYSDHIVGKGKTMFREIGKKDLEGIVAKRLSSHYHSGRRTRDWLKIKHHRGQEAIICGFTEPKGARSHFGSLLLGVYDKGRLRYAGNTGTGFTETTLAMLYKKMKRLVTSKSPFKEAVDAKGPVTWVRPVLVANVKFTEWTQEGRMRHPVFLGLREDKPARQVTREKPR